jgi:hypothetical protein
MQMRLRDMERRMIRNYYTLGFGMIGGGILTAFFVFGIFGLVLVGFGVASIIRAITLQGRSKAG